MDTGYYVAYAGLAARMQALEVVASNLANSSTTGYKSQSAFYRALSAAQPGEVLSPLNQAVNEFGILGGTQTDMKSGSFESTGNPLDLAIESDAFFSVRTAAGMRFTRNGNFHLNSANQVVTEDGSFVLANQGTTTVPITMPTGPISVSPDGTISVGGALVASLHLIQFAPGTDITPEGRSVYNAPSSSQSPAVGPNVQQGMLESANLDSGQGATSLIVLEREAEMLGRAVTILSTDFDHTAVLDVPRV